MISYCHYSGSFDNNLNNEEIYYWLSTNMLRTTNSFDKNLESELFCSELAQEPSKLPIQGQRFHDVYLLISRLLSRSALPFPTVYVYATCGQCHIGSSFWLSLEIGCMEQLVGWVHKLHKVHDSRRSQQLESIGQSTGP